MRSNQIALFENKQAIIKAAKKADISSISLYKPIIETWDHDTGLLYFVISLNKKRSNEELKSLIDEFKVEATKILGIPFGMCLQDNLEQQISRQADESDKEIKQEMQERLDYSIPLEELTDEPWLIQFEKRKEMFQKKAHDSGSKAASDKKPEKIPDDKLDKNVKKRKGLAIFVDDRSQLMKGKDRKPQQRIVENTGSLHKKKKISDESLKRNHLLSKVKTSLFNRDKSKPTKQNHHNHEGLKKSKPLLTP